MTLLGNAVARAEFARAADSGALHHAWLFAGPEGVGKATFARAMAARLLAAGSGSEERAAALIASGAHPDFRLLARQEKENSRGESALARSITIDQVRALGPMFATAPALSGRRVVLIDAIDDLERPGASNALLKNLEEPPSGTIFLLVSHAPGRLLPTIRSRCRLLRFEPLSAEDVTAALQQTLQDAEPSEIEALVTAGQGSPGCALGYAGLELAALDQALERIARDGDPSNAGRLALAKSLALKAAQPRYEAFLDRVPAFIAAAARKRSGGALRTALDMHAEAIRIATMSRATSQVAQDTAFELASLVAALAPSKG